MDTLPNTQLMLKFAAGDDMAFTELMEKNFRRVIGIIRRFVAQAQDAEDLAQEVFLRIYKARDRYVASARFDTWIYHIITNLCFNHIRNTKAQKAHLSATSDSDFQMVPQQGDTPSRLLIRRETSEKVRLALSRLPPNQRMAVILAKYEGLSYQEIADVMETSVESIKSLLSRAKENLREYLVQKSNGDCIGQSSNIS